MVVGVVELVVAGLNKLLLPPSEKVGAGVVVGVEGVVVAVLKGESLFPPSEKVGGAGVVAGLLNIPDPKILLVVFEVMLIESCGCAVAYRATYAVLM